MKKRNLVLLATIFLVLFSCKIKSENQQADLAYLRPEDRIDVIKIDSAADGPVVGFEFGGIGDFRERLVAARTRKAVADEAAALRRQFDLLARKEHAVRIRHIVQIPVFDLRVRMRLHQPLRAEGIEIIVFAEPQRPQQRLAALQGFGIGKPRLMRGLIVQIDRLTRQQNDIVKLGLAVLQQIVSQRGQPDRGDRDDAEHRKTNHHQQLGGYFEIAKHGAPCRWNGGGRGWRQTPVTNLN